MLDEMLEEMRGELEAMAQRDDYYLYGYLTHEDIRKVA